MYVMYTSNICNVCTHAYTVQARTHTKQSGRVNKIYSYKHYNRNTSLKIKEKVSDLYTYPYTHTHLKNERSWFSGGTSPPHEELRDLLLRGRQSTSLQITRRLLHESFQRRTDHLRDAIRGLLARVLDHSQRLHIQLLGSSLWATEGQLR